MSKDYYNILGVDKSANQEEIKKAFRKKAHEYHPDKKSGDEAKFKEVNEAYQILGDPKKRSQYDQFGSDFQNYQQGGGGGYSNMNWNDFGQGMDFEDLGDIFGSMGDIFGFSGGRGRSGARARGADLEVMMSVSFEDAIFGAEKEISIKKNISCSNCQGNGAEPGAEIKTCDTCKGNGIVNKVQRTILGHVQTQQRCPDCQGEGKTYSKKCKKCGGSGIVKDKVKLKVKIPAGISEGQSIRLSGQGEAGPKGAPAGDLYITVKVEPHESFERQGDDIKSTHEINIKQAVLGDKIKIPTVDGKVSLKIPEGTQSGTTFRLKEKGAYHLHGRGRGDHLVKIIVEIPTNLSRKQKEQIEKLDLD